MAITRLGNYGGPRQPYGAFAPKATSDGKSADQLTRLGLYGGARQLYGTFSGKTPAAGPGKSTAQLTRLGLYGGARQLYGDFSGKTEAEGLGGFGSGSPQGSERRFRLGLSQEPIKFITVSRQFDVEVPGTFEPIEQTPSGIQGEIDRHLTALQLLEAKLNLLQSSMIMKVVEVENDAMMARQFLQELQLRVMELRRIKKRRADEEALIVILMADE